MAITNEPIMLNETGLLIKDALDRQNGYLAMLAEGKRSEIYSSMSQIASLVRTSSLEDLANLFPIGDQIIMPWKDLDDSNHNTDETAYQVAWDIVHRGMVTLQDGSEVPGLFLQMHLCSTYGVQFSHQQAFANCVDGLEAGTYHVTLGSSWGTHAVGDRTYQFTLTQAVPAGGRLSGFEGMPDQAPANWRVKSWATPASANPIETVVVTEGEDGTDLGTMNFTTLSAEGLNCMQAVAYGHNRWATSALRQYLNSKGSNWWASKENFDIRPDQYDKKGFMSGFGDDFLAAIKPIKVTTALNTVEGFNDATEDTFDTFFVPSLEQMNVNPQLRGEEGDYFEYWRSRLALSGFASTYPTVYDAFKIPALNANSAQHVRLRSANRGIAHITWFVGSSGYGSSYYASDALRFSPVCVIC